MSDVTPTSLKKGDYVYTPYDDGAKGTILYGVVESAGPIAFTVCWESGIRNRLRQEDIRGHCLRLLTRDKVDENSLKRLDQEARL